MERKPDYKVTPEIKAFDLFCGAGGLTNGLTSAGIAVVGGIDTASECKTAYEENNPGAKFHNFDVRKLKGKTLNSLWGNSKYRLLAGCAPCQPFSNYNQAKICEKDVRYPLMSEFSRLIKDTTPEFVTMENVPNVLQKKVFQSFIRMLKRLGYSVSYDIVVANRYDVPQMRKRLVLLASRISDYAPQLPEPMDSVTLKERIGDLPNLKAGETDPVDSLHRSPKLSVLNLQRIRASKPGGSWRDWPLDLRAKCHNRETGSGYTPVYGRMSWEKPAPTLTTQCYNYGSGRFGHPAQDRAISLREAAIIQGFPRDYKFEPYPSSLPTQLVAKMIGNAVPVGLGKAIGLSFINHLNNINHARRI